MMNRIGMDPVSRYSISFGQPLPTSKILLRSCSSICSRFSRSAVFKPYHASEFVNIVLSRREALRIRATSNRNGPNTVLSSIDIIWSKIPWPLSLLALMFFHSYHHWILSMQTSSRRQETGKMMMIIIKKILRSWS